MYPPVASGLDSGGARTAAAARCGAVTGQRPTSGAVGTSAPGGRPPSRPPEASGTTLPRKGLSG
jgi:hypothetical protein